MKHIPNIITVGRILCVPVLMWMLMREDFHAAFYLAMLMGVSDALDGFLAKRCRWQSRLGEWLDPLADKLMLVSTYAVFGLYGLLPLWLVALVVGRDVVIAGGYVYHRSIHADYEVKPSMISKFNTLCQILLVFIVLLDRLQTEFALGELVWTGVVVVAATTLLSGAGYILANRNPPVRRNASRAV